MSQEQGILDRYGEVGSKLVDRGEAVYQQIMNLLSGNGNQDNYTPEQKQALGLAEQLPNDNIAVGNKPEGISTTDLVLGGLGNIANSIADTIGTEEGRKALEAKFADWNQNTSTVDKAKQALKFFATLPADIADMSTGAVTTAFLAGTNDKVGAADPVQDIVIPTALTLGGNVVGKAATPIMRGAVKAGNTLTGGLVPKVGRAAFDALPDAMQSGLSTVGKVASAVPAVYNKAIEEASNPLKLAADAATIPFKAIKPISKEAGNAVEGLLRKGDIELASKANLITSDMNRKQALEVLGSDAFKKLKQDLGTATKISKEKSFRDVYGDIEVTPENRDLVIDAGRALGSRTGISMSERIDALSPTRETAKKASMQRIANTPYESLSAKDQRLARVELLKRNNGQSNVDLNDPYGGSSASTLHDDNVFANTLKNNERLGKIYNGDQDATDELKTIFSTFTSNGKHLSVDQAHTIRTKFNNGSFNIEDSLKNGNIKPEFANWLKANRTEDAIHNMKPREWVQAYKDFSTSKTAMHNGPLSKADKDVLVARTSHASRFNRGQQDAQQGLNTDDAMYYNNSVAMRNRLMKAPGVNQQDFDNWLTGKRLVSKSSGELADSEFEQYAKQFANEVKTISDIDRDLASRHNDLYSILKKKYTNGQVPRNVDDMQAIKEHFDAVFDTYKKASTDKTFNAFTSTVTNMNTNNIANPVVKDLKGLDKADFVLLLNKYAERNGTTVDKLLSGRTTVSDMLDQFNNMEIEDFASLAKEAGLSGPNQSKMARDIVKARIASQDSSVVRVDKHGQKRIDNEKVQKLYESFGGKGQY